MSPPHPADEEVRPPFERELRSTMRMLPASDIAERGIICSFLLAPQEVGGLCAEREITHAWFHSPALGTIFSVLMGLWALGERIDNVILTQKLADRGLLEQVGGAALVAELFTYLPTATNVKYYRGIMDDKRLLRAIITLCVEYMERAYTEQDNSAGLLAEFVKAITDLAGAAPRETAKTFKESLLEKLERIEEGMPEENVIRTGIRLLDYNSPLHRGDMPMIAGEKKAGKSILSLTIAMNIVREGGAVLYFSLEDRTAQVIDRIFAGATHIPIVRQNKKSLNEGDFPRIIRAVNELHEKRMQIRDDVYDLAQIVAVARQQKSQWPDLTAIFVDYLQLVRTAKEKGQNREQEVATVSRALRLLGMELDAAVVVLSQLNEAGKSRESRAIEQDVTAAWMVNKPEKSEDENRLRVISIPFQRNGDSGIAFPVTFHGHFARIEDCANPPEE